MVEGFKHTEVGLIPSDWEIKKMNAICDVRDGTHESPKYYAEGVIFITSKNIVNGKIDFSEVSYISIEDAKNIDKRSKVDKGDILMSMIGTIGNCVFIDFEPNFCIKNVALLKPQKVSGEFLVQILSSDFYQQYIRNNLDGGIQKFISLRVLRNLEVALPPTKAEQTAIATALNDADALIQKLEQLIAKKRNIKTGAMQELLKPKEGWEVKKLGEVSDIIRGGSPRPIEAYLTNDVNGINWIKIGDVDKSAKYIYTTEEKIISKGAAYSRSVKEGDFLLSNSMSFGRPYILKTSGCVHDGWLVIQNYHATFVTDFLYYLLGFETTLNQYKNLAAGSTVLNLNKEIVAKVSVNYPSLQEQTRIAQILSDMDNEIQELEKQLEKYKMLKQGMMQSLLTGKIRLN